MTLDPNESQLGAEIFAQICCGNEGTFVDIGCSRPDHFSNTLPLLRQGWAGYQLDNQDYIEEWYRVWPHDSRIYILDDAGHTDWELVLGENKVDYLSIDVDEHSFLALANFMDGTTQRPTCITVEHEAYRLGPAMRTEQRLLLGEQGYDLVANNLWNFEDWWIDANHPQANEIALSLSEWGGEDNNDIALIRRFKDHLLNLLKELS